DEQIAFDNGAVTEPEPGHVAADGVKHHLVDLAFDPLGAIAYTELAQEPGVQGRVEMISVIHGVVRQMREAAKLGRPQFQAIVAEVAGQAALAALTPEMLEAGGPVVYAGQAERVDIVLAARAPVLEADA